MISQLTRILSFRKTGYSKGKRLKTWKSLDRAKPNIAQKLHKTFWRASLPSTRTPSTYETSMAILQEGEIRDGPFQCGSCPKLRLYASTTSVRVRQSYDFCSNWQIKCPHQPYNTKMYQGYGGCSQIRKTLMRPSRFEWYSTAFLQRLKQYDRKKEVVRLQWHSTGIFRTCRPSFSWFFQYKIFYHISNIAFTSNHKFLRKMDSMRLQERILKMYCYVTSRMGLARYWRIGIDTGYWIILNYENKMIMMLFAFPSPPNVPFLMNSFETYVDETGFLGTSYTWEKRQTYPNT